MHAPSKEKYQDTFFAECIIDDILLAEACLRRIVLHACLYDCTFNLYSLDNLSIYNLPK